MVYSGTEGTSGYSTGLRTMSDMRDFLGRRSACFLVAFLLTCLASRELFPSKYLFIHHPIIHHQHHHTHTVITKFSDHIVESSINQEFPNAQESQAEPNSIPENGSGSNSSLRNDRKYHTKFSRPITRREKKRRLELVVCLKKPKSTTYAGQFELAPMAAIAAISRDRTAHAKVLCAPISG